MSSLETGASASTLDFVNGAGSFVSTLGTPLPSFPPARDVSPLVLIQPVRPSKAPSKDHEEVFVSHLYDLIPHLTSFDRSLNWSNDTCRYHGATKHRVLDLESGAKNVCERCMEAARAEYLDDDGF